VRYVQLSLLHSQSLDTPFASVFTQYTPMSCWSECCYTFDTLSWVCCTKDFTLLCFHSSGSCTPGRPVQLVQQTEWNLWS